jgi:colanic acid biosynthesis glycosyl transferase WcaI
MLASGRATVAMARRGTALHEAVSSRGVVVPPDNVKALVAAINLLASDSERRAALGRAARNYAECTLSPEATIHTFEERLTAVFRQAGVTRAKRGAAYFSRRPSTAAGRTSKPATAEEAAPD